MARYVTKRLHLRRVDEGRERPKLFLVKPDLAHYAAYTDMMEEWLASGTQVAPWFLDRPPETLEGFAALVRHLDDCQHGRDTGDYSATTSYFVEDEAGALVGAASLRHYLTVAGLRSWGHVGYGVRPSRRGQGCGTQILRLLLEEAGWCHLRRVLAGAHEGNLASRHVIENCGGVLEDVAALPGDPERVCRYWLTTDMQE